MTASIDTPRARLLAWLVHLYTASGLLCAALMAVLIVRGGDEAFRLAFGLMVVATVIDASDGWLARKASVKTVLPHFDGRTLDEVTDFQTWTTMPMLLLWRADTLPGQLRWLLVLPLLASAYGYSQTDAKTADGFFLGFPSCWNVVAFYLYFIPAPVWIAAGVIVGFSALTFVPTRYLYPSQGGRLGRAFSMGGAIWAMTIVLILVRPAAERVTLALVSSVYPIAYLVVSWVVAARTSRFDAQP